MKKCNVCGESINDNDIFCKNCKTAVSEQMSTEQTDNVLCPSCNAINEADALFCGECGERLTIHQASEVKNNFKSDNEYTDARDMYGEDRQKNVTTKKYTDVRETYATNSAINTRTKYGTISSDEQVITTLGNGVFQNVITDSNVSATSAVLTRKRVYFSGYCFTKEGKSWRKIRTSKIINIEDFTGAGFITTANINLLMKAIILVVIGLILGMIFAHINELSYQHYYDDSYDIYKSILGTLLCVNIVSIIVLFFRYIFSRKTLFEIEYAGGKISFDIKWISYSAIANFHRELFLAKDKFNEEVRDRIE